MHHRFMWMLVWIALPGVAAAEGVRSDAVAEALHDQVQGVAADASAALDLRVDATQVPDETLWLGPGPIETAPARHYTDSAADDDQPGLSFGVEVKPRKATDGLARNAEADQPGLQDDVEKLIEHSTLGLRGTYRF